LQMRIVEVFAIFSIFVCGLFGADRTRDFWFFHAGLVCLGVDEPVGPWFSFVCRGRSTLTA